MWVKAPCGGNGECIEVANIAGTEVALRTTDKAERVTFVGMDEFREFIKAAKDGLFDEVAGLG